MDILEQIIETKRRELAEAGRRDIECPRTPVRHSLREALAGSPTGIIAEFKRKSPSKGWIHADADPSEVVPAYEAAGAAVVSILTDKEYFGGSLEYIERLRPSVGIPILRKDFIIDKSQLYEARAAGADAVLLIAACLSRRECRELLEEAHAVGLEVLLEVHGHEELDYITPEVDVVGVNNRHLGSFVTNVRTSFMMAPALRERGVPVFISESGISSPDTVRVLRAEGFRGFLMGENFMKEPDPGKALSDFLKEL